MTELKRLIEKYLPKRYYGHEARKHAKELAVEYATSLKEHNSSASNFDRAKCETQLLTNFIAKYNRDSEKKDYMGLDKWVLRNSAGFFGELRAVLNSADNTLVEQLHSDEVLVSKIEDIVVR